MYAQHNHCATPSLQSANQQRVTQRVTQRVAANASAMADPGPPPLTGFPGQLPELPAGVWQRTVSLTRHSTHRQPSFMSSCSYLCILANQ